MSDQGLFKNSMDKKVNLSIGQLLASGVTIMIAVFAAWISLTGRVRALEVSTEIRFRQIEKTQNRTEDQYEKILDELGSIKLTLENKEDRK